MNGASTTEGTNDTIEGHVIWSSFVRTHLITGSASAVSLVYSFFSLFVWRQGFHIFQFVLFLLGIAGMVYFCISLFTVVTYFRFDGKQLVVNRFGRRQRKVTPVEISLVQNDKLGTVASLWLRDGSTLQFCFKSLPQARKVVEILAKESRNASLMEGHANVVNLVRTWAPYFLPSAIGILIPMSGAILGLVAQRRAIWNGGPFAWFLAAMMFLPLVLVLFMIYNRLGQVVAYYRWDGELLRFRKLGRRKIGEYSLSDVVSVTSIREASPLEEGAVGFWVTMRNNDRYKLLTASLPNGQALGELLKRHLNRVDTCTVYGFRAVTAEQMDDMQRLKPLFEENEELLWLARPRRGAAWGRILAEVILGIIFASLGGCLALVGFREFMRVGEGPLLVMIVGFVFVGVGLYMWSAPWRYHRLLSKTLYAVTNRRAFILDGVFWDSRGGVQRAESAIEVVEGDALEMYEVLPGGRNVSLGCFGKLGRKGTRWIHRGFFAPEDLEGAVKAIKWGIHQRHSTD
jgi:hypothetical protein